MKTPRTFSIVDKTSVLKKTALLHLGLFVISFLWLRLYLFFDPETAAVSPVSKIQKTNMAYRQIFQLSDQNMD